MEAIQIKFLGCTNTKPSRLKAWTEGGLKMVEALDYSQNIEDQARALAVKYCHHYWKMDVTGFGSLPNGDFVATVGE